MPAPVPVMMGDDGDDGEYGGGGIASRENEQKHLLLFTTITVQYYCGVLYHFTALLFTIMCLLLSTTIPQLSRSPGWGRAGAGAGAAPGLRQD